MAFQKHNPNIRSPFVCDDPTWGSPAVKPCPDSSKENGFPLKENQLSAGMMTNDKREFKKDSSTINIKSGTGKRSTKLELLTYQEPLTHELTLNSGHVAYTKEENKRKSAGFGVWSEEGTSSINRNALSTITKDKNVSWKATSNLNRVLSQRDENTKHTNDERNNISGSTFAMQSLSLKKPIKPQSAALKPHNASAFTKPSSHMNYSAATRINLGSQPAPILVQNPKEIKKTESSEACADSLCHPKLPDYNCQLLRLLESSEVGAAERAESLLRDMLARYEEGVDSVRPDGSCYNHVIHAYAKSGRPEKAEVVLRLMFDDYSNGNQTAEPNVRVFTNLLHAWRKSQNPKAPENCEKLLAYMDKLCDTNRLPQCKPDVFAVTVLLHCWVESGRPEAGNRAAAIFRQMKTRFLEGNEGLRPDCICFSLVLNTFAQESKFEQAEEILWEMVDDFLGGNDSAKPRTRNFNTIMAMYARSNLTEAPQRAASVLSRFRELCASRILDNYPDTYTYSLLLKSWVTSNRSDAIEQAVASFLWMRTLFKNESDQAACPDIVKYTTIISAMARKGDSAQAESLLNMMIQDFMDGNSRAEPDIKLFDAVISSWTGSDGKVGASESGRAESILRRMWQLTEEGTLNVRPRPSTYKAVIVGLKKSHDAARATDLLWEMDQRVGRVDKKVFQTVLNAWHESNSSDKQYHIQKLRNEMSSRFGRSR